ncbi:adenylate kinase [Alicyclobacillus fodiniaquatilis]|uniref:Adenylate kinase n=1 Tax=Alicyclobacillus fodiniaquatilis TaxID=1661150 RepID=A0ABW4JCE1_9BACL
MQVILVGLPGAGKGTQAERIQSYFGIPHISTGDMFRRAVASGGELGQQVQSYLNSGRLVPDEITIKVVQERLVDEDAQRGFLLDGFPRTLEQADALDGMLTEIGKPIDAVLYIHVSEDVLLARLTGRRICRQCGTTYHVIFQPPKEEGVCDKCGGELYQRSDDSEEAVKTRLEQYKHTAPLIEYYRERGVLRQIDGLQPIEQVFEDVQAVLAAYAR